jgi:hypothetical protein
VNLTKTITSKDVQHIFIGRKKPKEFDYALSDPSQAIMLNGWPRSTIHLHFSKEFSRMRNREEIRSAVLKVVFGATYYIWIITSDEEAKSDLSWRGFK